MSPGWNKICANKYYIISHTLIYTREQGQRTHYRVMKKTEDKLHMSWMNHSFSLKFGKSEMIFVLMDCFTFNQFRNNTNTNALNPN